MKKLLIVDIETSSPNPEKKEWALDHNRNVIDLVGIIDEEGQEIFSAEEAKTYLPLSNNSLGGHNFKFDFKSMKAKGFLLDTEQYTHDTLIMATASIKKIPDTYLEEYNEKRRELNKNLPKGRGYRDAGKHSLKTLAPYFLGVSPFWENTETTNDALYLSRDIEYTQKLFLFFQEELKKQGTYQFYIEKLMPWARMTLQAELDGIKIDLVELDKLQAQAEAGVINSLKKLRQQWVRVEEEYYYKQIEELKKQYAEKKEKALTKAKDKTKCEARYSKLLETAISKVEPFNYSSPSQMLWALKDCLKYNVVDMEGDESTGAQVLEVLAKQGKEDIKALLEYRENYKLAHSYFPSYKEVIYDGRIYCNFNIHGTRTGRLSSSSPNLQQVPPGLKKLFVAEDGNVLISLDLSSIEPVLIAYYTEDERLCDILINRLDFHGFAAVALFNLDIDPSEVKAKAPDIRYAAKQADLSMFYGSGANRLFSTLTLNGMKADIKECKKMVYRYRDMFPEVFEFKKLLDAELQGGNAIDNIVGRRIYIENKEDIYMKGFNTLVQSSGSDILLKGTYDFLEEMKASGYDVRLRLLVHDNTVVEAPAKDAEYIKERLNYHLTKFNLKTKWGRIPMAAEGGISKEWTK